MKKLLIIAALMIGATCAFADELEGYVIPWKVSSVQHTSSPFDLTTIASSFNDDSEEENERPNVLIINTEEIYEATGIIEQELLIEFMKGKE